ncbi:HlyD family type I secretion periplasmic adaptor subunit, partial [Salmonella enterica subsp. enterica serovar Virchow]|nr:HlyD family type I secretion periplasmic adaptor subunit [Salmonella enterica subsp. enterica serovar Virchow]
EPIMLLVPVNDDLVIDARVPPTRIDDIAVGQAVRVRFPAFDMATTPECHGKVARMSADLLHDQQQNISYYEARVTVDDEKACLTDRRTLIPGMPAELYIQTGERSVWSYLFKPILDQLARAFKE